MSLNPFHGFRKHQKTLLAVLTIFTMIIFIFSFGPGDIFSGGGRGRAGQEIKPVATLFGQSIYPNDIQLLQQQREQASLFMLELVNRGQAAVIDRIKLSLLPSMKEEKDQRAKAVIEQFVRAWEEVYRPDPKRPQNQFAMFAYFQLLNPREQFFSPVLTLRRFEAQLGKDQADKKEDINLLIAVIEQEKRLMPLRMGGGEASFFGGGSMTSVRDLLDFKMWLHEADRLGINISDEALMKMARQDALNQVPKGNDVFRQVYTLLAKRYRGLSEDELNAAIRNEYRARLARVAVLGFEAAGANVPPAVTPYDIYQFYKENRTENSIALLPVTADRKEFLSSIAEPKEEELRAFYNKYKKREDDPGASEPGFKAPPKRTIEWVRAQADSPFYKQEAKKERDRIREATVAAMQVAAGQLAATGLAPSSVMVSVVPKQHDLVFLGRYNEMRFGYPAADWFDGFNTRLHDESMNRPETVAALVGQAIGVGGTQTTVLSAPAALVGAAYSHDAKHRTRVWTEAMLAGTQPTPFHTFGIVQALRPEGVYMRDSVGVFLPPEKIRDVVEEKVMDGIAKRLVHENLKTVDDELDKLANESGDDLMQKDRASQPKVIASTLFKALAGSGTTATPLGAAIDYSGAVTLDEKGVRSREAANLVLGATIPFNDAFQVYQTNTVGQARAQAYLAEAIKKYGLERGATTKPRDQYDIADDAGLTELKAAFEKPWNHATSTKPKKFANMFFPSRDNRTPMSPYRPQPMPPGNVRADRGFDEWAISNNPALYWTTSEKPGYVPEYAEVRNRVLERWKLTKAREMAKKDAEAIAAEINKANGADAGIRILRNKAEKIGTNIVYLDRVARLSAPGPAAVMARQPGSGYDRFKVPEDRVEYPSARFLMELLDMNKPGEAKVLADRPESTYYVAVLQSRSVPDFYTEFSRNEKALMDRMEQDVHPRMRFHEGVIAQLEKDAKLKILDEQYEKDFRGGGRGRRGGGDE
jgi:hypothetical protein